MNKQEIITKMSEKVENSTKKVTEQYLDAFLSTIKDGIQSGEDVKVTGYFNFEIKDVNEREVLVNPRQPELGKKINPAHKTVKVKVGSKLKELV